MAVRDEVPAKDLGVWFELKKKCCHQKRNLLCSLILAVLLPFVVLRLLFFYDLTGSFRRPSGMPAFSLTESLLHKYHRITPGHRRGPSDVEPLRPDEDSWVTHDPWMTYGRKKDIPDTVDSLGNSENENATGPGEQISIAPVSDGPSKALNDFGLPEDNELVEDPGSWPGGEAKNITKFNKDMDDAEGTKDAEQQVAEKKRAEDERKAEEKRAAEQREAEAKAIEEQREADLSKSPNRADETTKCDFFDGDWEHDQEAPLYTNFTCSHIQGHQNCMKNGRPDTDYLHWRWKPRSCDLPRFDAASFLETFRGKTIAFVGDSLARNQMQSLLCMLSQVEDPIRTAVDKNYLNVRWLFKEYQVGLAVVWSPFLMQQADGMYGFSKDEIVLHLDAVDTVWTSQLPEYDIVVLSAGQWYLKRLVYVVDEQVIGCHYCPGLNLTDIGVFDPYRDSVREVLQKVVTEFSGIVVMTSFAMSHFDNGEWSGRGDCRREQPISMEDAESRPGPQLSMRAIVKEEFDRIANDSNSFRKDVHLEFLDVTKVALRRADGHPGPYRHEHPYATLDPSVWVQNDCLHWCLPGPVDTWNQLLVQITTPYL